MSETLELLRRWNGGDQDALGALVERDIAWIESHVRRRLGPLLRRRADTQDIVQITLVEVLRCGPRFVVSDRCHLRALLARMVENVLRVQANHHGAQKRDVRREITPNRSMSGDPSASSDSVLNLDFPGATTSPDRAAERSEIRDWVRLALELMEPQDRDTVVWRDFEDCSFAEIADRLGVAEDAARMRYRRALPKLARTLRQLRQGRLDELL